MCYNEYTKDKEQVLKTRKGYTMKKSTLEAIRNYLNGDSTVDLSVLKAEIDAEWDKTAVKARANAEAYAAAHDVVMAKLASDPTPMTAKELYAECENDLPEGFTPSKLQYALTRMWQDEVTKDDTTKGPNTYTAKV